MLAIYPNHNQTHTPWLFLIKQLVTSALDPDAILDKKLAA